MSDPIALGGSGTITLGPSNGNQNEELNKEHSTKKMDVEDGIHEEVKKEGAPKRSEFRFKDEIKIGDETIFTIPVENIFYEENNQRKRKSRWGEKPDLKKKVHQDVVFNPYQALTGGSHLLPITDGRDPHHVMLGIAKREEQKQDQKKTKWGPDWEKTFQPPIYHVVPKGMSIDDLEYLQRLHRLDEISRNLNLGEYEIGDNDIRSPSPEPEYDKNGIRVNTRVNRARNKLERERADLIEECAKLRKNFVPPADYKPPKKNKKIFLPEELSWDGHNRYISLIIGPKGVTQKALEHKTGCKISVRGKGSSFQKRMEYDSDEKLHVYVQAESDEALDKGAREVERILRGDAEESTETEKAKMLQIQAITRTLGDDYCENCGEKDHRAWNCPNKLSFKRVLIKCEICGDRSHPTSDCPKKKSHGIGGLGIYQEFSKFMNTIDGSKTQEVRNSRETTGFLTNNINPILALTDGSNSIAYPQPATINAYSNAYIYGAPQTNVSQQSQQQTPQETYRPAAYTMATANAGPAYINPMLAQYNPNFMSTGQISQGNVTITSVNPNTPLGMASNPAQGQANPFQANMFQANPYQFFGFQPNPYAYMGMGGQPMNQQQGK